MMDIAKTYSDAVSTYKRTLGLGNYAVPFRKIAESGKQYPFQTFLPGHIYSFDYVPPFQVTPEMLPMNLEQANEQLAAGYELPTKKPYFDFSPIGMSIGKNQMGDELIVNFRVIPQLRIFGIMEGFWQIMRPYIERSYVERKHPEGKIVIELRPITERFSDSSLIGGFYQIKKTMLSEMFGANLTFAVNKYNSEYIKNRKLIDWDLAGQLAYGYTESFDSTIVLNTGFSNVDDIKQLFELKM